MNSPTCFLAKLPWSTFSWSVAFSLPLSHKALTGKEARQQWWGLRQRLTDFRGWRHDVWKNQRPMWRHRDHLRGWVALRCVETEQTPQHWWLWQKTKHFIHHFGWWCPFHICFCSALCEPFWVPLYGCIHTNLVYSSSTQLWFVCLESPVVWGGVNAQSNFDADQKS